MAEKAVTTRDAWQKWESIAKIFAGFSAAIGALAIPFLINSYSEQNRRAEVFIKTMTEREKADTDIRQSMFHSLLTGYLGAVKDDFIKENEQSFRRRIMFLELLTVNFQEFFNAKPLFEDVYAGIKRKRSGSKGTVAGSKTWDDLEQDIIRVARNVASRQATMLNNIGTSAVFYIEMEKPYCVRLYDRADLETLKRQDSTTPFQSFRENGCLAQESDGSAPGAAADGVNGGASDPRINTPDLTGYEKRHSLELRLVEVAQARAKVQVTVYEDFFGGKVLRFSRPGRSLQFDVSYFDLPYMDNTKLSDGSRFALVLRDVHGNAAEMEALRFKNDFMSLRDRPLFEEMLQKLQKDDSRR